MKLNPPPYYRMWIYGVNGLIIFLQVIFLILTQFFMADPRFRLFPITLSDPTVIFMFIAHSAQFIACFFGILGVFLLIWLDDSRLLAVDVSDNYFRFNSSHFLVAAISAYSSIILGPLGGSGGRADRREFHVGSLR